MNYPRIHVLVALAAWTLPFGTAAYTTAPAACPNPIQLLAADITPSTCGNAAGAIAIQVAGGNNGLVFNWSPQVSSLNSAINLPAGVYQIEIVRQDNPACRLDTSLVVSNADGPAVLVADIQPANCLASNGAAQLMPNTLQYAWSNGDSGAFNDGLSSQCYSVTATNPGTGCFTVLQVCIPNENPLQANALVLKNAKCGRSIGKAEIQVSGGSGQYAYSLGGPVVQNLPPGNYACIVNDNTNGCRDTAAFSIANLAIFGSVDIQPNAPRCAGGLGGVSFDVLPAENFELPYIFSLTNADGQTVSPGALPAGLYFLSVADADSCSLPTVTFIISNPPPLVTAADVSPRDCDKGGQIQLTPGGGLGHYIIDWLDLPGTSNPEDRVNLGPGLYQAIVYDSVFCSDTLSLPLLSECARTDTLHLVVAASSSATICVPVPVGFAPTQAIFSLPGNSAAGSSGYGAWGLNATGCLTYNAGLIAGLNRDTVCIITDLPAVNVHDTTCIIISITPTVPSRETVYFTVQASAVATACGTIPAGFTQPLVQPLSVPGFSGDRPYGMYDIHPASACLTFSALNFPGFNIDSISVSVCDALSKKCHIISYVATVLPLSDCSAGIVGQDTLALVTTDCLAGAKTCLPIPYSDILNYNILDNGLPYNQGSLGCLEDTVTAYAVNDLPGLASPDQGPYQLDEWRIDGQPVSGVFSSLLELLALMNQLDPVPGWSLDNNFFIVGGNNSSTYGPLKINAAQAPSGQAQAQSKLAPRGSELRFATGLHTLVFKRIQTGCLDTLRVNVICYDCPAVHPYAPDVFGNIEWDAPDCARDTVFCTNIPSADIAKYVVTDNGQAVLNFTDCGGNAGLRLDTGYHEIRLRNTLTTCAYVVKFYLDCPDFVVADTLSVVLGQGEQTSVCLDTTLLDNPIISMINACDNDNGNVSWSLNEQNWCVQLTGQAPGLDTLCIQLCNGNGECALINLLVQVRPANSDSTTLARPDQASGPQNQLLSIPVLVNDLVLGAAASPAGLLGVAIVQPPQSGMVSYNSVSGTITYTPDKDFCGTDVFVYQLIDLNENVDTALVTISIFCDDLVIYNGFSPNGDGVNDRWIISGIEQFPDNEVSVFNRWGNLVFQQKNYSNQNAWDGRWTDRDLPDGAYFYLIDLGDGSGKRSGSLQLLR